MDLLDRRGIFALTLGLMAVLGSACSGTPQLSGTSAAPAAITAAELTAYPIAGMEDLVFIAGSLTNTSAEPDTLLGGTSAIGRVEISGTSGCADGTSGRITLPQWRIDPGETIHLVVGSGHLTITGAKTLPQRGTEMSMTLTFARAGAVPVTVAVEPTVAADEAAGSSSPCAG
jgi:copper(I)-binding protein